MMNAKTPEARETLRLEELLDRVERRPAGGIPFAELRELGRLYRAASARLARMRARADDPDAIRHLNALCVRGFTLLHAPPPRTRRAFSDWARMAGEVLGRTWQAQVTAWLLLFAGLLVGGILGSRDNAALHVMVPASLGYSIEGIDALATSSDARAEFFARDATPMAGRFAFGSMLFVNNTRVGLLAFATGIFAGLPTILLQLFNGMMLGAFFSIFLRDPVPIDFLAWILPHGIPELTAISLCCAAGLQLGRAVALPGRGGRRKSLQREFAPALTLVAISVPLFVVAAIIESFVRESGLGSASRLAVGLLCALGLVAFLLATRRLASRSERTSNWLADLSNIPLEDASTHDRS